MSLQSSVALFTMQLNNNILQNMLSTI